MPRPVSGDARRSRMAPAQNRLQSTYSINQGDKKTIMREWHEAAISLQTGGDAVFIASTAPLCA